MIDHTHTTTNTTHTHIAHRISSFTSRLRRHSQGTFPFWSPGNWSQLIIKPNNHGRKQRIAADIPLAIGQCWQPFSGYGSNYLCNLPPWPSEHFYTFLLTFLTPPLRALICCVCTSYKGVISVLNLPLRRFGSESTLEPIGNKVPAALLLPFFLLVQTEFFISVFSLFPFSYSVAICWSTLSQVPVLLPPPPYLVRPSH